MTVTDNKADADASAFFNHPEASPDRKSDLTSVQLLRSVTILILL